MIGAAPPPRPHYTIWWNNEQVTEVCSGTQSPSLGAGIGMAYLPVEASKLGTPIEVEVRGKRFPAEVVKKPFYKKPGSLV
jgi:aminomethyltransferase